MMKLYLVVSCLVVCVALNAGEGKFINPISDVCWDCIFPITVAGKKIGGKEEVGRDVSTKSFCRCPHHRIGGIPISFWEPTRLVDVTRHAYKLMGLGGISLAKETVKNRGSVGTLGNGEIHSSFYHVHWYFYPLISWLEVLTNFLCLTPGDIDVAYMSEFDVSWNKEFWALLAHPEAILFNNPAAQLACIADCAASSVNKPIESLFWCGGCEGSLYPFVGTVAHYVGGVQASSLLLHRMIAKFHRLGMLTTFSESSFCSANYEPIIKKKSYKTQLVYPVAQTKDPCNALGRSDVIWGAGKSYPYGGEDFVYLLWTKKHCCLGV
jgi:conjugal transfer pilus assembly protein TraU